MQKNDNEKPYLPPATVPAPAQYRSALVAALSKIAEDPATSALTRLKIDRVLRQSRPN